jgi:hypothetical protein
MKKNAYQILLLTKKEFLSFVFIFLLMVLFVLLAIPFQSCDVDFEPVSDTCTKADIDTSFPRAYKPNIYIHPVKNISIDVNISFPHSGAIVTSIPLYDQGWHINVDTTGKINHAYDYLFYESDQPDGWQYQTGWAIAADSLNDFFSQNMAEYGFSSREIGDFVEYWIPRLKIAKYYLIYPQEKEIIDRLIKVDFSLKPDHYLRLFYRVMGSDVMVNIKSHTRKSTFTREGFYVTEWGVI